MPNVASLKEHETQLAEALLPAPGETPSDLTEDDRFKTHAYLVLACALVEEHIEGRFREFVERKRSAAADTVDGCFVSLATRFAGDLIGQNGGKVPPCGDAIPTLAGLYESKIVNTNNGVKKSHVENLAKPLGIAQRLEGRDDLFRALNVLGAKRGAVAHLGMVEEVIAPPDARGFVVDVLDQLHLLDEVLDDAATAIGAGPSSSATTESWPVDHDRQATASEGPTGTE